MTCGDRRLGLGLFVFVLLSAPGCWPAESTAPAPFDCDEIDRADERFPDECGDAGVSEDADVPADGGEDAAP